MTGKRIVSIVAHRLAILAYVAFALFPLYWLLKGMCSDWLLFGKRFDLAKEGAEAVHRLMKGFQRSSAS